MDWPIFFTVLGSAFAVIGCVYQFLRNFKSDINTHIDRLDANLEKTNNRLDRHAAHIDQLYQMFVDLLQAKK